MWFFHVCVCGFFYIDFAFVYSVALGIEPRTSCILEKHSTTRATPITLSMFKREQYIKMDTSAGLCSLG